MKNTLKCLIADINAFVKFKPALVYDSLTGKLTATFINGKKASTAIAPTGSGIIEEDIPVVLSGNKSFGKYVSGQTVPATGMTLIELMRDVAMEYVGPKFNSFSVQGQSTTVEVGTTLAGTKTFLWSLSQNSGEISGVNVEDLTVGGDIGTGLPNTGNAPLAINSITFSDTSVTQSWKAIGINTTGANATSPTFTVNALFKRFYGTTANGDLATLDIATLQNSELSATRLQTRTFNGGGKYMSFAYPASHGLATFNVNGLANTAFSYVIKPFTNTLGITEDYIVYRTNTVQNGTLTIQVK